MCVLMQILTMLYGNMACGKNKSVQPIVIASWLILIPSFIPHSYVPFRIRVAIARKRNEDEDAVEPMYSLVTLVSTKNLKGKGAIAVSLHSFSPILFFKVH